MAVVQAPFAKRKPHTMKIGKYEVHCISPGFITSVSLDEHSESYSTNLPELAISSQRRDFFSNSVEISRKSAHSLLLLACVQVSDDLFWLRDDDRKHTEVS